MKGEKTESQGIRRYFEELGDTPIEEWDDNQILLFHTYLHQQFSRSAEVEDLHALVVSHMQTRGMKHKIFDEMDQGVDYVTD